jgi:hypothetical protein
MDIKLGADMDMDQEDIPPVIHCDNCRKQTGSGSLGNHWICEDCRLAEHKTSEENRLQFANRSTEKAHEDSSLPPTNGLFAEQQHVAYAKKAR